MANTTIIPTRMELTRLKKKLVMATRGHKLLKDKRDELMRQFLEIVREAKTLREQVEERIKSANSSISLARSLMQKEVLETALLMPKQRVDISVTEKNIMSVDVPEFDYKLRIDNPNDIFSYGYAFTGSDLDDGVLTLAELLPDLLRLCEKENAAKLLSDEIEKTRRRVNALEYVMIPDLQTNIRFITMKLDENERSSQARLMKVKDMMVEEMLQKKQT